MPKLNWLLMFTAICRIFMFNVQYITWVISEYELLIMTERAYFIISIKADFNSVHSDHLSFYFEYKYTHTHGQLHTARRSQPKKNVEKEFNLVSKSLTDIPILICTYVRWPTLQISDYVIPYCTVNVHIMFRIRWAFNY